MELIDFPEFLPHDGSWQFFSGSGAIWQSVYYKQVKHKGSQRQYNTELVRIIARRGSCSAAKNRHVEAQIEEQHQHYTEKEWAETEREIILVWAIAEVAEGWAYKGQGSWRYKNCRMLIESWHMDKEKWVAAIDSTQVLVLSSGKMWCRARVKMWYVMCNDGGLRGYSYGLG